jgi:hypothetical protein
LRHYQNNYLESTRTAPLSRFELKAGWDIPAILEQALNSDLPGEIKALVRENVYDTATGRHLLIPQGSRLVGSYDSRVSYGQDGLQVAWGRIVYPDASSINLEGMSGQDAKGYTGLLTTWTTTTSAFLASDCSQASSVHHFSFPKAGAAVFLDIHPQAKLPAVRLAGSCRNSGPT